MTEAVGTLSMEQIAVAFMLAVTRISAFIVAGPLLGQGTVPNKVKFSLCMAFAIFWFPEYAAQIENTNAATGLRWVLWCLSEFMIGISLGYLVRLVFLPCTIAGSYLGQEFGFNLGQVSDPSSGDPTNEMRIFFDAAAVAIFWISNTDHYAWKLLGGSIVSIQASRESFTALAELYTELFSVAHERGVMIVAPLASIMWLTLIALTVVMKVWPQVTLFSFGMGVRLLVGFAAFFYFMPQIMHGIHSALADMSSSIHNHLFF